jgi:hypothetical protein
MVWCAVESGDTEWIFVGGDTEEYAGGDGGFVYFGKVSTLYGIG